LARSPRLGARGLSFGLGYSRQGFAGDLLADLNKHGGSSFVFIFCDSHLCAQTSVRGLNGHIQSSMILRQSLFDLPRVFYRCCCNHKIVVHSAVFTVARTDNALDRKHGATVRRLSGLSLRWGMRGAISRAKCKGQTMRGSSHPINSGGARLRRQSQANRRV
jgi:hypothetical protein